MSFLYLDENRNKRIVEKNTNLKHLLNGEHHVAVDPLELILSHLFTLDKYPSPPCI